MLKNFFFQKCTTEMFSSVFDQNYHTYKHFMYIFYPILMICYEISVQCYDICMLFYDKLKEVPNDMVCYEIETKRPPCTDAFHIFQSKMIRNPSLPLISNVNIYSFTKKTFKTDLTTCCMLCFGMLWCDLKMWFFEIVCYGIKFQCYVLRFQCYVVLWCMLLNTCLSC